LKFFDRINKISRPGGAALGMIFAFVLHYSVHSSLPASGGLILSEILRPSQSLCRKQLEKVAKK